jgi:hypothetical protein
MSDPRNGVQYFVVAKVSVADLVIVTELLHTLQ